LDQPTLSTLQDNLCLIRGRERVLDLAPALMELARNTGQLGAMHWLDYFLSTRARASKPPYLILQLNPRVKPEELRADDIRAAALFFEYQIAGFRTGLFSTDDAVGYRTVIAAAEERERFAYRAARALLDCGAHIVLSNYESASENAISRPLERKLLFGRRERKVPRMLRLFPTYEETLAQFGHSTRFNLRYYRRRLAKRVQLEFVDDARPEITMEKFRSLDVASLDPLQNLHEVTRRWRSSCDLPDSFVVGLRSSEGKWLSLIGGWRHETTTVLHWQLNVAGYEQDSIGTVMRSFFIEHEVARGAQELLIYGGTPHTIRHAFKEDTIVDLMLCRNSLRSQAYRMFARHLNQRAGFLRSNHLIRTLGELDLHPLPMRTPSFRPPHLASLEPDPQEALGG
jgi:hypothetical protein